MSNAPVSILEKILSIILRANKYSTVDQEPNTNAQDLQVRYA